MDPIQQFEENGYVILRGLLPQRAIDDVRRELKAMVDEMAAGLVAMDHVPHDYADEPFETRLIRLFAFAPRLSPSGLRRNLHRPGMYAMFFCTAVLDVVERILGPEIRLYPNYTVRPKLPDDVKTQVLWHQDAGYTHNNAGEQPDAGGLTVNDLRMVNIWTSLVPARPSNGCMQFIPGTHKLGVVPHEDREHYLEISRAVLEPRLGEAVDVETDPGDVVLFNNLLFHQGQPNTSGTVRWSCDWRYQDATQPTLRREKGHLARSAAKPAEVVQDALQWAELTFS